MDIEKMRIQLIKHEAMCLYPYKDSAGKLTIGVGRNLSDKGISQPEAVSLLEHDIAYALEDVHVLFCSDTFGQLGDVRQRVLVDMAFNLGRSKFSKFRRLIAAVQAGEFEKAADEMADSRWYQQVGTRGARLELMMRTGDDYPQT